MTDTPESIDPTVVAPPMVVDATSAKAVASTLLAAALLVLSGSTTLMALLSARDVVAIFKWAQGSDGIAFIGAITLLGTTGWRVWLTIRKHARLVLAARAAPNSVAQVKGE